MSMTNKTLPAIHESRLTALLDELGLLQAVVHGAAQCAVCEDTITRDSIGGLIVGPPHRLLCSSLQCLLEADQFSR